MKDEKKIDEKKIDEKKIDVIFYSITVPLFLLCLGVFVSLLSSGEYITVAAVFAGLGALDGIILISYISCDGGRRKSGPYTMKDLSNDIRTQNMTMWYHPHDFDHYSTPKMHIDVHEAPKPDHWLTHFTGELIRDTTGFDLLKGDYHDVFK